MAGSSFLGRKKVKPLKKHLSISEQVELMKSRGLIIRDDSAAQAALAHINYYRLSGYLHSFKVKGSDHYAAGLTWERLQRIYDFDRKFTQILMFALEDIEETLKTRFSYILSSEYPEEPLIYLDTSIYRDQNAYQRFVRHFEREIQNNRKLPFVKHHIENYDTKFPIWVAVELFTMGNLHAVYDNLVTPLQKKIARSFQTGPVQLASWIENLTYTRNHLAHFMRIYKFNFGRTFVECKYHPFPAVHTHMIFDQIFIMKCLYSTPQEWNAYVLPQLQALFEDYQLEVQLMDLGFPENWESVIKM